MNNQSIQAKQLYLRQNILDAGYDPEQFMGYCQQNEGQINLQGWAFGKLQNIVQQFIISKSQRNETTFTPEQLQNNDDWSDFTIPKKKQDQVKYPSVQVKQEPVVFSEADWGIFGLDINTIKPAQKFVMQPTLPISTSSLVNNNQTHSKNHNTNSQNNISKKQQKKQTQKSVQPETKINNSGSLRKHKSQSQEFQVIGDGLSNSLPKHKIIRNGQIKIQVIKSKQLPTLPQINDISIIKTQQKSRNLFKGDYTLYHIKFNPCGLVIQRKFNDFRKLRNIIQKLYPHIRVPYLEPQGWLVNSSEGRDPQMLNKYKSTLIQFLKYVVMRNQTLKKSKVVRVFTGFIECSTNDLKKYDNIAKPKMFSQLCLPQGTLNFSRFQSLVPVEKYMTNTSLLMLDIDSHYQKLRKSLQTLFYNYDQVTKSITDVACIFQSLQNTIHKFNMQNDDSKDLRIYEGIKQACLRMRQTMNNQHEIFKNKFQNFFKYERENMTTIKQINEIRNKMYAEYSKQGLTNKKVDEASIKPKGQIIVEGNMHIEQPTKNNKNILKIQSTFWSHFALESAHKYWQQLRYKINDKLATIAYQELDNQNQNLNFWNNIIKRCVV